MYATISIRQLTKQFDANQVFKGIDLEIAAGRFVVLLGPSGGGKTTLLCTIAGITDPSSGGIWLKDRRINDVPPEKRNFGLVFQTCALFPHLSTAWALAQFPFKLKLFVKIFISPPHRSRHRRRGDRPR